MTNDLLAYGLPSAEQLAAQVHEQIEEGLQQFKHQPMDEALRHRVERFVRDKLQHMIAKGEQPPNFWRHKANGTRGETVRGVFNLYMVRDFRHYPMTEDEFVNVFSRRPDQDDLHRVNCKEAGKVGHYSCGWCMEHETARWDCACTPFGTNVDRGYRGPTRSDRGPGGIVDVGITPGPNAPHPLPVFWAPDVGSELMVFSCADVDDAHAKGLLDGERAMALKRWFMANGHKPGCGGVRLMRHVPENTPPEGRAVATRADIDNFVRARFPDVHDLQVEEVPRDMRYVLTVTTHLAGRDERDDLQRCICAAIEPYAVLGVAFEVRAIPVDNGPYR